MAEIKKENVKSRVRSSSRPKRRQGGGFSDDSDDKEDWQSKMIDLRRVTRVMAGGKRFKFRACVVLGNGAGRVGVGVSKGADVAQAINKASNQAKRNIVEVSMVGETIPHEVTFKYGTSKVLLKPAPPGAGIIAGGAVRTVVGLAGIKNISGKLISRSSNKLNNARATIGALKSLRNPKKRALKPELKEKKQNADS